MSIFVEFENRAPWSPGAISTLSIFRLYNLYYINQIDNLKIRKDPLNQDKGSIKDLHAFNYDVI
jgi:hypothetical protein